LILNEGKGVWFNAVGHSRKRKGGRTGRRIPIIIRPRMVARFRGRR
jgi:hypothetical protein